MRSPLPQREGKPRLASEYRVRQEARIVAGDRAFILPDREPAGRVVDQPAPEHRILPVEMPQTCEGLADEAFAAIGPLLLRKRHALADQHDIPALARIKRLANVGGA